VHDLLQVGDFDGPVLPELAHLGGLAPDAIDSLVVVASDFGRQALERVRHLWSAQTDVLRAPEPSVPCSDVLPVLRTAQPGLRPTADGVRSTTSRSRACRLPTCADREQRWSPPVSPCRPTRWRLKDRRGWQMLTDRRVATSRSTIRHGSHDDSNATVPARTPPRSVAEHYRFHRRIACSAETPSWNGFSPTPAEAAAVRPLQLVPAVAWNAMWTTARSRPITSRDPAQAREAARRTSPRPGRHCCRRCFQRHADVGRSAMNRGSAKAS